MGRQNENLTTQAVIAEIQRKGATTLAAIAQELEARGDASPAGVTAGPRPRYRGSWPIDRPPCRSL